MSAIYTENFTGSIFTRKIGENGHLQYFTSPMNSFLTGTVAPALESALGVQLKRPVLYQQYNEGTYDSPEWYSDPNNWEDDDSERYASPKVFLPSLKELTGETGLGCEYADNGRQFPLLALIPGKVPAKNTGGDYIWQWSRTPSRYPGNFCYVSYNGNANNFYASIANGVRPAFCL